MKYRIPEHITIQTIDNETIKDIIFHELDESEFLVHYLKDPELTYTKILDDGTRLHYLQGRLVELKNVKTIDNNN